MPSPSEPAPSILVVDDNEQNRALAQATLEGEDYVVVLATNGEEALRAFAAQRPSCVLLDVRMPGMNGFEVCERIRALPGGADTPIVFLTAQRDIDTFDAALRVGGDDFLTKPVRPTELVLRIQAALRVSRLNASNREYYELARRQRDDLMRLQLQKERLMAFVVHDLKNPVSSLDLHAQLLLRDKELPERLRGTIGTMREEVRALMRLIMNLLDISKSEEGKLEAKRTSVDARRLVTDIVEAAGIAARAKGVTLEQVVTVEHVSADVDLLRRVLENLLDNALRHAPEDSTVRVSAERVDGDVEFRVVDRGSGVPPEMRERVFDPFVQVETKDKAATRGGRGLGLAFCRLAVEAHGGRVWIDDAGPGADFHVRVPQPE